uniref:PWWP domain containing 2B n=2 Tax=Latimeria chalumnae TaxID=7897 RepID=H3A761_LATCH
ELQVGSRIPVLIERIVNDTLVVSLDHGNRSYTGILLDCSKKSGLFCLPSSLIPKQERPLDNPCMNSVPAEDPIEQLLQMDSQPSSEKTQNPSLLLPPGTVPSYPPYFEGAPFPQPLWLRHTYNQWVPQPPPRAIKRTKRRLSRNRDSGRLIMSTIRLRPRQVLCEKCKNTLNSEEDNKDEQITKAVKKERVQEKEPKRYEVLDYEDKKCKKEKKEEDCILGEIVHRSPVIKISYNTPQGKGEVVKIPSRVHGSIEPFCPKLLMHNESEEHEKARDSQRYQETKGPWEKSICSPLVSIPKLKLTRPLHSIADAPPPKIRLKPHHLSNGKNISIYKAELIDEMTSDLQPRRSDTSAVYYEESTGRSSAEMSSGSSEEEEDLKKHHGSKDEHGDLALLLHYRKRKADSSSLSVCSNDSLDESKSSSSEVTSPEMCDFTPGDDISVSSSSNEHKIVPPLTVRLHTKTVTECVTEEGRTISVGDIVWGKIHGFPWWPARILSISISQKENGIPSWQEAKVSWFGSPTTSLLSVSKLSPFLEFFKLRFNRKKKGVYRKAIAEAAKAAEHLTPEIRALLTQFDT